MDQEMLPLSEAKTRFHELLREAETRDLVLLRHGRPVGALLGYRRYRALLEESERASIRSGAPEATGSEVARICRRHRVRRLTMFGSAARGDDDPSSDIDLLVEFAPMPPGERAEAYFGLQADLARLFGRSVDLLEESAVRNPYLERSIAGDRRVVYEAA